MGKPRQLFRSRRPHRSISSTNICSGSSNGGTCSSGSRSSTKAGRSSIELTNGRDGGSSSA
eukprot:4576029-Pyramimonas_sp.AAC.1